MTLSDWFSALYESVSDATSALTPNDVYAEAAANDDDSESGDQEDSGEEKEVSARSKQLIDVHN
jgi:hypothetical protein